MSGSEGDVEIVLPPGSWRCRIGSEREGREHVGLQFCLNICFALVARMSVFLAEINVSSLLRESADVGACLYHVRKHEGIIMVSIGVQVHVAVCFSTCALDVQEQIYSISSR